MGELSNIGWTDHTYNRWIGCTKVSAGCVFCYAETQDNMRFSKTLGDATKENPISHWGKGAPRYLTSDEARKKVIKWNDKPWICNTCGGSHHTPPHECSPSRYCGIEGCQGQDVHRARVFSASLSDWLDDEVPIEWLADLLKLIHDTKNLNWLLLTKRPENFKTRLLLAASSSSWADPMDVADKIAAWANGEREFSNVWVGTSVENQAMADKRIPLLLSIPAKVRFLSIEPLLEKIDLSTVRHGNDPDLPAIETGLISWAIVGGESGGQRRDCGESAIVSVAEQCVAASVPVFVKQDCAFKPGIQGRIPDNIWNLKQFPNP